MPRSETPWSGGDPDRLTAWTLVRSYHSIARVFYGAVAAHGLTPQQFGVLVQLAHQPGVSQAALARAALATPQALGVMLRHMVSAGWIDRQAPAGRGRPAVLAVSPEGRAVLDRATPDLLAAVGPPALGLDTAQDEQLNTLLHRVLHRGS